MKINSLISYNSIHKIFNQPQLKYHPGLSALSCDKFEYSNKIAKSISFGTAENYLTDFSDVCKKNNIINFMNAHKGIDVQDACICLAFGIDNDEDINRYKNLTQQSNQMSKLTAGLCIKSDLNENQIQRLQNILLSPEIIYENDNSEDSKWLIPEDEAVLCAKENFDDNQLSRYAQLRNRTIDLKDSSVRKTGGEHNYSPVYAADIVKANKTDEDLQTEIYFFEGIKQGLSYEAAIDYAKLDKNKRDTYLERYNKELDTSSDTSILYRQLLNEYAQLNKEQRKMYQKGIEQELNSEAALYYAQFNEEEMETYQKLTEQGYDKREAIVYAVFDEEQRKAYKQGIKQGFNKYEALNYALLDEQQRKVYKQGIKLGFDKYDAIDYAQLDEQQRKVCLEYIKQGLDISDAIEYASIDEKQRELYKSFASVEEIAYYKCCNEPLNEEKREMYQKGIELGLGIYEAIDYIHLDEQQRSNFNKLISNNNVSGNQAMLLVKHNISSITPEVLEQIPDEIWYLMQTGETEEVHKIIQSAINILMQNTIQATDIKEDDMESAISGLNSTFDNTNANLINKDFSAKLQKTLINNKPVLTVKDNNSTDSFIAYEGAIAYVTPLTETGDEKLKQDMKSYGNLLPEKQATILAQAAKEFVINLVDNDGNCILSKGLNGIISTGNGLTEQDFNPYTGQDKSYKETEKHYLKLITAMDEQNQLTAQNLLKILPKDSILSINPYTTKDKNMLYSISAEWKSNDGTHWQMRIHSSDLCDKANTQSADNWIFRLGYTINDDNLQNEKEKEAVKNGKTAARGEKSRKTYFMQKENDIYSFDGNNNGASTHIKFVSPIPSDNLLNNIDFQKDIRSISAALSNEKTLNDVCLKYNLFSSEQIFGQNKQRKISKTEKINTIIKDAMQNPIHYYEMQEFTDKLRNMQNLLKLG